jgi:hypothetical protein
VGKSCREEIRKSRIVSSEIGKEKDAGVGASFEERGKKKE